MTLSQNQRPASDRTTSGAFWKVVWTLSFVICAVVRSTAQGSGAPTCDPGALDADSYALTTRGIAEVMLEALAGAFEKTMGMSKFVGADRERFWRALGGCIDANARPEAVIPWSDVREIKGGNWVIWFKLHRASTIGSDNGKRKNVDEIKVNLHGATGTVDVYVTRDTRDPAQASIRGVGMGPFEYDQRVRYTIVKHVDPPDASIFRRRRDRPAGSAHAALPDLARRFLRLRQATHHCLPLPPR